MKRQSAFEEAMEHVLRWEGGFSDHPKDRGGPTKFGITHEVLAYFRDVDSVTVEDVKALTLKEACRIYKQNYWDVMSLSDVSRKRIAVLMMDQGVNAGPTTSIKRAQRCCNDQGYGLDVDGRMGPLTLRALNGCDEMRFCRDFLELTREHYRLIVEKNPEQSVFLKGWFNRVDSLEEFIELHEIPEGDYYLCKKGVPKKLSKNFVSTEFDCKCHYSDCTETKIHKKLVEVLQNVRDSLGSALHITSGNRCPRHNAAVGGVSDSQHLSDIGKAADIVARKHSAGAVQKIVEHVLGDTGGLGSYSSFTHVDVRVQKARWRG